MKSASRLPRMRYVLGLVIGLLGAWVAWETAPYFRNTIFMVPTVATVLAILLAGGFWPAMIGALLTLAGAVAYQRAECLRAAAGRPDQDGPGPAVHHRRMRR